MTIGKFSLSFVLALFILTGAATICCAQSTTNLILMTDPPQKTPPLVFEDAQGLQHALADYRGRWVLLNIWATWCVPCVKEMPSLDALQETYDPQKLIVLPLSEDKDQTSVTSFYQKHNILHLPVAVDRAGVAPHILGLQGFPTTLLIDPQGVEIAHMEGDADWHSPEILALLSQHIHQGINGGP